MTRSLPDLTCTDKPQSLIWGGQVQGTIRFDDDGTVELCTSRRRRNAMQPCWSVPQRGEAWVRCAISGMSNAMSLPDGQQVAATV